MSMSDMLRHAGIVSLLSMVIGFAPLAMAAAYFFRPTERRLMLMRPLSLAGLFASLTGSATGYLHVFRHYGIAPEFSEEFYRRMATGAAESLVPVVVGATSLTVAWLLVAAGMSRSGLGEG
jgi:formate hydrogenlyase subunit 3/multisubunit Na+/H+ antiporter MnhD subunit